MNPAPGITLEGRARLPGGPLFGPLRLDLAPGRWTGLLGGSGAGKTTLLRLIAGLETEARFEGRIAADDGAPLAGRVAYMAQDDLLLPWADVIANVTLGARLRGARADRARAAALIAELGLAAEARRRPHALSGGQRQRVALARTLMEARPVVLLDEPFSALDAGTRTRMQALAARMLAGATVLLVSHDPLELARLSHRAFLLGEGGLSPLPLPDAPPPRTPDAAATMEAQAGMLRALLAQREDAAA